MGAIIFALLVGLWIIYAMPRAAERRRVLGESHADAAQSYSSTARDLTSAARSYSRIREVEHMNKPHQILRPANPTVRPRFEGEGERGAVGASVIAPHAHSRPYVRAGIIGLILLVVSTLIAAAFGAISPLVPLISCLGLFLTIVVARTAHSASAAQPPASTRGSMPAQREHSDDHEHSVDSGAPNSDASGEVERAARHEAFLREVMERRRHGEGIAQAHIEHSGRVSIRYGSLSSQRNLEDPLLEEREAAIETGTRVEGARGQEIGSGMTIDEILERRRA